MKELIKKGFLLGLGAASLTKKQAERAVKGIARKANISRNDAEAIARMVLTEANKERKRLLAVIKNEAKITARRMGYLSKKEAILLKKKIANLEKKIKSKVKK